MGHVYDVGRVGILYGNYFATENFRGHFATLGNTMLQLPHAHPNMQVNFVLGVINS